jgi:hypothetical protein
MKLKIFKELSLMVDLYAGLKWLIVVFSSGSSEKDTAPIGSIKGARKNYRLALQPSASQGELNPFVSFVSTI